MRVAATTIVAVALTTACTHHRSVAFPSDIAGERITVETRAGVTEEATVSDDGQVIHLARGDMSLYDAGPITVTKRLRGALEGAALGALILGGSGAILGYASGDDHCQTDVCILELSAEDKAVVAGVLLGAAGGAAGLLVGALLGSHDVYSDGGHSVPQQRFVPTGPPGSVAGATIHF